VKDLVRTFAPGLVQFAGRRYLLEPPRVWHALTLMSAFRGNGSIGRGDAALVRRVLRDWWPPRMASAACAGDDFDEALEVVGYLVLTRTEEAREKVRSSREGEEIDWHGLIADFMAVYSGHSWDDVMNMPWPAFLNMARFEGRQRARTWLTYLRAKKIPYIEDDRERERSRDALREEAGWKTSQDLRKEKQPDNWQEQKRAIEALDQYAP